MAMECRFRVDYSKAFQLDIIGKISAVEVGSVAVGVLGLVPYMLTTANTAEEESSKSAIQPTTEASSASIGKSTETAAEKATETALLVIGASQLALSLALGTLGLAVASYCRQNARPEPLFIALGISSAVFAACNFLAFVAYVVLGIFYLTNLRAMTVHQIMILRAISHFLFIQLSGLWTCQGIKTAKISYTSLWILKIEEQPSESFSTPPSTPGFAKEAGMVPVHQSILNSDTEMYF